MSEYVQPTIKEVDDFNPKAQKSHNIAFKIQPKLNNAFEDIAVIIESPFPITISQILYDNNTCQMIILREPYKT